MTKQFLSNREEILSSMGAALFQGEGQRERRARVKTLFASIDMDGNVATWAERWRLDKDKLKQQIKKVNSDFVKHARSTLKEISKSLNDVTKWKYRMAGIASLLAVITENS